MVRTEWVLQRFAEVAQQVPAVGNLHGSLRGHTRSLGVDTTTIPAYVLRARVLSKPCGHAATVPDSRSGSRSITLRLSRTHSIVP